MSPACLSFLTTRHARQRNGVEVLSLYEVVKFLSNKITFCVKLAIKPYYMTTVDAYPPW
jgi:hypothetical protein